MPAYQYIAINPSGKEEKGVIEAENEKHARHLLRTRTLVPVRIKAVQEKKSDKQPSLFRFLQRGRGLTSKELAAFTRQFATLLAAGLPIEECLQAVAEQSDKSRIKGLIISVRSKVVEGHALASALREHPEAFSSLFCATVAAGEKSGHLDKVLLRLADYTEQQWQMKQKLKNAMIYPSMIVLVAVSIVGFLLEYVVPKMVSVYSHQKQALPTMTTTLISISNFVKADGFYLLLIFVTLFFFWRRALKKSETLRAKSHLYLLRLPLVGATIKTADTARFSRTLSILSAAGVPALEAMSISSQLITTIPIRDAITLAVSRVREGAAINLALKQTTYFPPMSIHMIASGEASGQLENMLERVAINQEQEIINLIDVSLSMFEPAVILIMGAVVLFIVLAVLLPIFNMTQFAGA